MNRRAKLSLTLRNHWHMTICKSKICFFSSTIWSLGPCLTWSFQSLWSQAGPWPVPTRWTNGRKTSCTRGRAYSILQRKKLIINNWPNSWFSQCWNSTYLSLSKKTSCSLASNTFTFSTETNTRNPFRSGPKYSKKSPMLSDSHSIVNWYCFSESSRNLATLSLSSF